MWEQEWDFDPVVGIRQLPGEGTPRPGQGVFQGSWMPGRQRERAEAQLQGHLGGLYCPSARLTHSTKQPVFISLISKKPCLSSRPPGPSRAGDLVHVWM